MSIPFSHLKSSLMDMLIAPRSLNNIAQALTDSMPEIPEYVSLSSVLILAPTQRETQESWLKILDAKGLISDIAAPEKPVEYEPHMDKADLLVNWDKLRGIIGNPEFFEKPMQPRPNTR